MFKKLKGEKVQLTFTAVQFKKKDGTLILTSHRLVWCDTTGESFSAKYAQITKHMVSAASSPQTLMKVDISDQPAAIFLFTSDTKIKDRAARNHITQVLSKSNSQKTEITGASNNNASGAAEESKAKESPKQPQIPPSPLTGKASVQREEMIKQRILEKDPGLKQIYKELVPNILTATEFWASRKELLEREAKVDAESIQRHGISSTMVGFSDALAPVRETDGKVHYQLTPEVIHKIFVNYPGVRAAYKKHVPHKMSEQQFWTKFFQSHYFLQNKDQLNSTTPNSKTTNARTTTTTTTTTTTSNTTSTGDEKKGATDIYADAHQKEQEERIKVIDPTVNLTYDEDLNQTTATLSARDYKLSSKHAQHKALLKKFNVHGALLVEHLHETVEEPEETTIHSVIAQKAKAQKESKEKEIKIEKDEEEESGKGKAKSKKRKVQDQDPSPSKKKLKASPQVVHTDQEIADEVKRHRQQFALLTTFQDLETGVRDQNEENEDVDIPVSNYKQYFHETNKERASESEITANRKRFVMCMQNWKPTDHHPLIPVEQASLIVKKFYPIPHTPQVKEAEGDIFTRVTETTYELLRHFWSALLNKDKDKVRRMIKSLKQHKEKLGKLYSEREIPSPEILVTAINNAVEQTNG